MTITIGIEEYIIGCFLIGIVGVSILFIVAHYQTKREDKILK